MSPYVFIQIVPFKKSMKKTLLIDMYGVIIEESKGNFIPYAYEKIHQSRYDEITRKIREEHLFSRAQLGEISSEEFLTQLGFDRPREAAEDYLRNYLTLDKEFVPFAKKAALKYEMVLLSNDVWEWSEYITELYGLNGFFAEKFVSGKIHMRKPSAEIFEHCLVVLGRSGEECIFIDNSVKNLESAQEFGITPVLFNRDGEEYDKTVVNNYGELAKILGI